MFLAAELFLRAAGWLEPLLDRIAANQSNVVTPVIDVVDDKTMQYKFGNARATNVGGFDWNLQFNWHAIPEREMARRKSMVDPIQYVAVFYLLFVLVPHSLLPFVDGKNEYRLSGCVVIINCDGGCGR